MANTQVKTSMAEPEFAYLQENSDVLKDLGSGFVFRPVYCMTFSLDQEQSHDLTTIKVEKI